MEKRNFYWLFSFLLVMSVFLPMKSTSANTLSDVPEKYAVEVNYLMERSIVSGYGNGEFKPRQLLTREEAATMIGRALKLTNVSPRETIFSDVNPSSFASGYIQAAYDQNVIKGYVDGTFKPKKNLTRLEMAYLLTSAFKLSSTNEVYYVDLPPGNGAAQAVKNVTNAGITVGYPDNTYRPNSNITRVEFALMLARALNPNFQIKPSQPTPEPKPEVGQPEPVKPAPTPEPAPEVKPEPEVESTTMYVTVNDLNIRKGPGTSFAIVGKLNRGDKVSSYSIEGDWVEIKTDQVSGYVHKAYVTTKEVSKNKVIAIDPGHGGKDPGAVGNGLKEKDIVLNVGLHLRDYLEQAGFEVVMTRSTDVFISLEDRVVISESAGAGTFVSLHMNSATNTSASGTETYSSKTGSSSKVESSKKLSAFIQDRLIDTLGTKDRGEKTAEFKVIKENSNPSVLVEMGFISNASDAKLVSTHEKETAEAIYLGIMDYFKWLEN
ncbi:N-acetylmuramoyl-L-alanine amidase [Lysinibacillus sp. BW-2-10]|uniref:N-acetylmuramoyl-L-alanine amidase n=1 Tax=Lysinibacillus sp. BW-2-10 TaxID=2590030 RepID=UPI0011811777|nr:N-acetylmuramoyl-L-alanine amidase [Lysinibacillus sp. BW-2-10]TSI07375.1 SH3 domain-containing protein [Lysinibacillus sp. BW-2-10]